MERSVEADETMIDYDSLVESIPETISRRREHVVEGRSETSLTSTYAKILGGAVTMLALLAIPVLTIPGTVILVIVGEVYLLDWIYSKFVEARDRRAPTAKTVLAAVKYKADKREHSIDTTGPKDQFTK